MDSALTASDSANTNPNPDTLAPPSLTTSTGAGDINLDECLCVICMDYLMDACVTGCSHKFCRYCINQWIRYNPGRRCPACRSDMGVISDLPQLDKSVTSALINSLSAEELIQRERFRIQRESGGNDFRSLNPFSFDEDRDFRNLHLIRLLRAKIFQTDNPWATQSTTHLIHQIHESIQRIEEFQTQHGMEPRHSLTSARDFPPVRDDMSIDLDNFPITRVQMMSTEPREVLNGLRRNRSRERRNNSINFSARLPRSFPREQVRSEMQDILISQYGYHLRRAESAYYRIMEGQRDFDNHTSYLQHLCDDIMENHNTPTRDLAQSDGDEFQLTDDDEMEVNLERIRNMTTRVTNNATNSSILSDVAQNIDSSLQSLVRSLETMNSEREPERESPTLLVLGERRHISSFQHPESGTSRTSNGLLPSRDVNARITSMTGTEYRRRMRGPTLRPTREEVHLPVGRDIGIVDGILDANTVFRPQRSRRIFSEIDDIFTPLPIPNIAETTESSRRAPLSERLTERHEARRGRGESRRNHSHRVRTTDAANHASEPAVRPQPEIVGLLERNSEVCETINGNTTSELDPARTVRNQQTLRRLVRDVASRRTEEANAKNNAL